MIDPTLHPPGPEPEARGRIWTVVSVLTAITMVGCLLVDANYLLSILDRPIPACTASHERATVLRLSRRHGFTRPQLTDIRETEATPGQRTCEAMLSDQAGATRHVTYRIHRGGNGQTQMSVHWRRI